ncbi:MAG TPA: hypothetical protein VG940_07725 [Gemmatimonadales bacterium]|nr:hypothetical protein [Gemmatimonadales bacterium]
MRVTSERLLLTLTLAGCASGAPAPPPAPMPPAERCHQLYLAAGSDGPRLLAVDAVIVDSSTTPPLRCGQVRSAHPAIKSSE